LTSGISLLLSILISPISNGAKLAFFLRIEGELLLGASDYLLDIVNASFKKISFTRSLKS